VIVGDENQIAVVPDLVKRACVEEAIAIYREESTGGGGGRAELQAAGVQSVLHRWEAARDVPPRRRIGDGAQPESQADLAEVCRG